MAVRNHVVVDGSNIATEGRTTPSLDQLEEAVDAFRAENPGASVTVVVDASFPHRIDESERDRYEAAVEAGELVSPPAGAIGRGDGFLLQIADRTGGAVLSNDSFQEFHGTYEWLFDTGRLIGAKPVPGVGWIFSVRTPVRGERSRKAVREAERDKKAPKVVRAAIEEASADALAPDSTRRRSRRGKGKGKDSGAASPPPAVNEPDPFLRFVATHPPGSEVEGRVDSYASHGAFVDVDGTRGYVPLAGLGDPAPASAREVLRKGETYRFAVQAVDAPRRNVELALPEFTRVSGAPSAETVEAAIEEGSARTRRRRRQRQAAKEKKKQQAGVKPKAAKSAARKKAATTKKKASTPKKKAPSKKAPSKKAPTPKQAVPRKAAKKTPPAAKPAKKSRSHRS